MEENTKSMVAATLAAALFQKQATGPTHNTADYIVTVYHQILGKLADAKPRAM